MQEFHIHRLTTGEARVLYPLVREAEPKVDLDQWLEYARRAARNAGEKRGILVATRQGQRFPSGLFCYRCHEDLTLGHVVVADYFVAVDILDPSPVVGVMVRELETLGERLKCDAICSVVHNRTASLSSVLEERGHRREASAFIKRLTSGTGRPTIQ